MSQNSEKIGNLFLQMPFYPLQKGEEKIEAKRIASIKKNVAEPIMVNETEWLISGVNSDDPAYNEVLAVIFTEAPNLSAADFYNYFNTLDLYTPASHFSEVKPEFKLEGGNNEEDPVKWLKSDKFQAGMKRLDKALSQNNVLTVLTGRPKLFRQAMSYASSYITVIGSRSITEDESREITDYTKKLLSLEPYAKILSGGTPGSDAAAIKGAGTRALSIIPADLSSGAVNNLKESLTVTKYPEGLKDKLNEMTLLFQEEPEAARNSAVNFSFLSRDNCQVMFPATKDFTEGVTRMVVFVADEDLSTGEVKGGTAEAVFLARLLDIPTFNLRNDNDKAVLDRIIESGVLPEARKFNHEYLKDGKAEDMYDVLLSVCRDKDRDFLKNHTLRGFFENDGELRFEPRSGRGTRGGEEISMVSAKEEKPLKPVRKKESGGRDL